MRLLFLFFVFAGTAFAQCQDKVSTADMMQCYDGEFKKADADLNSTYKATLAKLKGADADRLRTAQRAWVSYRDAQCNAAYKRYAGGTIAPVVFTQCKLTLTLNRTKELK